MGIDQLKFRGDDLNTPDRDISLMGWRPNRQQFAAKTYMDFIEMETEFEIYFSSLNTKELKEAAKKLESWDIDDSDFGITRDPTIPDRTAPKSKYNRGPICQKEVDDMCYLFKYYSAQGATLVHQY